MRKTIKCKCHYCDCFFFRKLSEHCRSVKLKRFEFCSRAHSTAYSNKIAPRVDDFLNKPYNSTDKYTQFRWFLARIRERSKRNRFSDSDITLEYLVELWNDQNGICPLTNWKLLRPLTTKGNWETGPLSHHASLDRIDSSK